MDFQTLDEKLFHVLTEDNITPPNEDELALIKKIKQGKHLHVSASEPAAINYALLLSALIKAPQAFEGSPRVLWITESSTRVTELVAQLRSWIRRSEIAVEPAHDKGKIIEQRNHIFEGADIIIGTPKRVLELYNQNGIHVNQLTLVLIDEANAMCKNPLQLQAVRRVCESIEKSQKMIVSYGSHDRLNDFVEEICYNYEEIAFPQ